MKKNVNILESDSQVDTFSNMKNDPKLIVIFLTLSRLTVLTCTSFYSDNYQQGNVLSDSISRFINQIGLAALALSNTLM